jgi:hypothetical protein
LDACSPVHAALGRSPNQRLAKTVILGVQTLPAASRPCPKLFRCPLFLLLPTLWAPWVMGATPREKLCALPQAGKHVMSSPRKVSSGSPKGIAGFQRASCGLAQLAPSCRACSPAKGGEMGFSLCQSAGEMIAATGAEGRSNRRPLLMPGTVTGGLSKGRCWEGR